MKNIVTFSIPALMNSSNLIIGGLRDPSTGLQLRYADPDVVQGRLAELNQACGDYEHGILILTDLQDAMTALTARARATAMTARDVLKPFLGNQYSQMWDGTGYTFSLETPRSFDDLLHLLTMMGMYLANNPAQENAPLNITSAKVNALVVEMTAARYAFINQTSDVAILLNARNEKMTAMRRCLRQVIDELKMIMEPLDPRWLRFGLNMPSAKETPDVPRDVKVKIVEETTAMIEFQKSARAEYYRVYQRVVGVDEQPRGSEFHNRKIATRSDGGDLCQRSE